VDERCQKLGKPLFSEKLLLQLPGEDRTTFASRLPEALVQIAEDFGSFGTFYKTQLPLLWVEDNAGNVQPSSSTKIVRDTCQRIAETCPRPLFLLSAAVDFAQYAAQYALVADLVAAPMCGRAYFKEAFTAAEATSWNGLEDAFRRIAVPRVRQMRALATARSRPWWHAFEWIAEEGHQLIHTGPRNLLRISADFGY
jgi:tagatose-1,6-bisphosphate aldolase